MKKYFLFVIFALSFKAFAQVPVSPVDMPYLTFTDAAGLPCAGCKLYSYAAGTTTPLATYVDSSGTSQNTNPITLNAAGGANIWVGGSAYKFILKSLLGVTIWTVDNVTSGSGGLGACGSANAIIFANSSHNGVTCDAVITINGSNHTLNVGTLPANYVTIGALGTPTSWVFDTTSPATALAAIGGTGDGSGTTTPNQLVLSTSTAHALAYSGAIPAAITATTQAINDNSTKVATTAYAKAPGAVTPTSVAVNGGTAMTDNQGTGVKVQHSTGSTTTNHTAIYDASGNVVDSGVTGIPFTVFTDVTGSRILTTSYQNTGAMPIYVSGYATLTSGSGDSTLSLMVGPSTPSVICNSQTTSGTIAGERVAFSCIIPPGYFYELTATNLITGIGKWTETQ